MRLTPSPIPANPVAPGGSVLQEDSSAPHPIHLFLAFAFTYFFAALLRAITATLAPVFSAELSLGSADLGLLAGAYFFGFAAVQLPLGWALDRHGPRRTLLTLLALAVVGCMAFALSPNLPSMILARLLVGMGLGACLMAALTSYRRWYSPVALLRANSWMLMTGSLGMLASTLPVQWLLPAIGWRGLFWFVAAFLLASMALLARIVPVDSPAPPQDAGKWSDGYAAIARSPLFRRLAPMAFFAYGGLIAMQSLWAGPWLTRVCAWTPQQAAQGLFAINLAMLFAFLTWGTVMPRLSRKGWSPERLIAWGLPISFVVLACIVALGARAGAGLWALWCVTCTFVSVSQPAVGASFSAAQAGRALSAFNLVIFGGVFFVQWGLGLVIDAFQARGLATPDAFRAAIAVFGALSLVSYLWFLWRRRQVVQNGS